MPGETENPAQAGFFVGRLRESSIIPTASVRAAARAAGISTNVPRRPPSAVASSFTLSKRLPPAQRLGLRKAEATTTATAAAVWMPDTRRERGLGAK